MRGKVLLRLATMVAMVLLTASCEREHHLYQGGEGGGGGDATGKKLIRESELSYYTSTDATDGYFSSIEYTWTGNNIVGVKGRYWDDGNWFEEPPFTCVYDGDKLMEARLTYEREDGEIDYMVTVYFTYTDGRVSEIYVTYVEGNYSEWVRRKFTYSNDGHIQNMTSTYSDGDMRMDNLIWASDNLITLQQYENGSLNRTINYTYDSKKSAYSSLPMCYVLCYGSFYDYDLDDYAYMLSTNNVILKTMQTPLGYTYNDSYTYTYNGDYPVQRIKSSNSAGIQTTYYEYTDGTGVGQVPQVYGVSASTSPSDIGYVRGDGAYAAGSTVILHAYTYGAYSNYSFQQWSDGNTQNPRTVVVNGNANYTAIFTSGGTSGGTLLSENFDNGIPSTWKTIDADGDGYGWFSAADLFSSTGIGHSSSNSCAASQSFDNPSNSALTPDNYLVSPSVTIPNSNGYYLRWYVAAQDASYPSDYYTVYVGYTSGNTFIPYGTLYSETISAKVQGTWRYRLANLNSYKGQTVQFAFRHHNCTDQFVMLIDDVSVSGGSKLTETDTDDEMTSAPHQREKKSFMRPSWHHRRDKSNIAR